MFTFQITFKSEVCGLEPQFGGNKIPLAAASCIWKSFAKRDRVCYLGKLDVLRERDEVTLAFPQAADVRKELQAKAMLAGPDRRWGDGGCHNVCCHQPEGSLDKSPAKDVTPTTGSDFQKLFRAITDASAGCAKLGVSSFPCSLSPQPGAPSWTHRRLHLQ